MSQNLAVALSPERLYEGAPKERARLPFVPVSKI